MAENLTASPTEILLNPQDATIKASAPNLQRGLQVLEFLATKQPSATVSEFAERLGYPIASLYRIVNVMTEMGYLRRDETTKRYTLTNKLLQFGQPQQQQRGLVEACLPSMRGLLKATGETVQVCSLVETEVVVLEQLISTHPFKYSCDVGARTPLHSCAPGKAILAWLPESQQREMLSKLRFKRFTATTITSAKRMRDHLEQVVAKGYAIDDAEGMEGIRCVAAPILTANKGSVGAITIAAPANRVAKSKFDELGAVVREAAKAASQKYGR